jgi:hypothetical protein
VHKFFIIVKCWIHYCYNTTYTCHNRTLTYCVSCHWLGCITLVVIAPQDCYVLFHSSLFWTFFTVMNLEACTATFCIVIHRVHSLLWVGMVVTSYSDVALECFYWKLTSAKTIPTLSFSVETGIHVVDVHQSFWSLYLLQLLRSRRSCEGYSTCWIKKWNYKDLNLCTHSRPFTSSLLAGKHQKKKIVQSQKGWHSVVLKMADQKPDWVWNSRRNDAEVGEVRRKIAFVYKFCRR